MRPVRRCRYLAAPAVLAALLPVAVAGQEARRATAPLLRGVVVDARSGRPLAATVHLLDSNGGALTTARCDVLGHFTIRPAEPGVYGLMVEHDGYRTEERQGIGLWPGDTISLDLRLEAGPALPDDLPERPPAAGATADGPFLFGVLVDDATGLPIEGGSVALATEDSAVGPVPTRSDGTFVLWPDTGTYRLRAEALGYRAAETRTLTLGSRDTVQVEIRLSATAFVLEPLRVVARGVPASARVGLVGMDDFFDRYARYIDSPYADFMTRDSLAVWEERAHTAGHMLQWTSRFVRAVDPETGEVTLTGGCQPSYYLNGSPVPHDMVETLSPGLLEAVEVYLRPAIPARLGRGDPCGVVSFWSRQSPPDSLPENQIVRRVAILGFVAGLAYLFASALW